MEKLETLIIVANKRNAPGIGRVPAFIIDPVVKHCRSLQDLQFQSASEAPTLPQLAAASTEVQSLGALYDWLGFRLDANQRGFA